MRIIILIVFILLTGLYGYQLWSKHRSASPTASETEKAGATERSGAVPALPGPPDLTAQRLALEKALSGIRISSLVGGTMPLAQIAGRSYQVGEAIAVPGSGETVTIRSIGDGFVIYSTGYHPEGFRVDLSREKFRTVPPAN